MTNTDPTVNTIRTRFSEFVDTDPATIQFALDEAKIMMGSTTGNNRLLGLMYLTAHIIATGIVAADNGGREVRHESIGRLSVSYQNDTNSTAASPNVGDLESTMYGKRYLRLMAKAIKPFATIIHNRTHNHGH